MCSATVTVRLNPPVLTQAGINLLTNDDLIRERTEQALKEVEGVEGVKQPLPSEVLMVLRAYIRNSWKDDPKYKAIKVTNRRFVVRFGPDGLACKQFLESLGFELQVRIEAFTCSTAC